MKIMVLLKETPDTEAKIAMTQDKKKLDFDAHGTKWIVNPYDENAVEEALKYKDKDASAEIVILSYGPQAMKERMIKALAMGADRGVLIDQGSSVWDANLVAHGMAKIVQKEKPDLILTGKQSIDDGDVHVPLMLAELLNWPHMNSVSKMSWDNSNHITVERELDGGAVGVYGVSLPAVIGCHQALGNPRYASLPGIMKAKKKPLDVRSLDSLGAFETKTEYTDFYFPQPKAQGKMLVGDDPKVLVDQLIQLLRDEAKVL